MAKARSASTYTSSPSCPQVQAGKGKRGSTYFEQYGGEATRRALEILESGARMEGIVLESGSLVYPDPRLKGSETSSNHTPYIPGLQLPRSQHALQAQPTRRNLAPGLSIDAAASRGVKVVPANLPTAASTFTPPPTPSPPLSPPAMLSPLEQSTCSTHEPTTPGPNESGRSPAFGAPRVRRKVVIKESERTRRWAEEMIRFQSVSEVSDAVQPIHRSTEKSPPRREILGTFPLPVPLLMRSAPVSTDLMDSFISELNPDAKLESPRFPPLTPLSPWEAYSDKARGSRSSSRQRSRRSERGGRSDDSETRQPLGEAGSPSRQNLEQQQLRVPTPPRRSSSLHRQSSLRSASSSASATPSIHEIVRTHSPSLRSTNGSPRQKIPTIDEIVKRHAGAAEAAQAAARKSILSSHTFSNPASATSSPLPSPQRPVIAARSTSHAQAVKFIPPRTSSKPAESARRRSTDSIDSNVVANQALLEHLAAVEVHDTVADQLPIPNVSRPPSSLLRSSSTKSSSPSYASSKRLSGVVQLDSPVPIADTPTDPATHTLALYIRSPRLTRIIKVPGSPQLSVSIADVGSAYGKPIFVFLGLGCVRYLIALFDDLAETLGLRLICIDRWGLGKTDDIPQDKRTLLDWARIVEHVADELGIEQFGLLAHSAGAPYALATALRLGPRIVGTIHLLSPWVSSDIDGGERNATCVG